MHTLRIRILACAAIFAAVAIGCSNQSAVEGIVTLDGTPVEGASISFVNAKDAPGKYTTARSGAGGKFTVETDGKPGMVAGEYKVLVSKTDAPTDSSAPTAKPGTPEYAQAMNKMAELATKGKTMPKPKDLVPAIYKDPVKSPLSVKVPVSGTIKLEMTSK